MAWTDEKVERLSQLWKEGFSAAHIARDMGDVTRNAVIGKLDRMGLTASSGGRVARVVPRTPRARRKPVVPRVALEDIKPLAADDLSVMTVKSHHCRWPVDRPGTEGTQFCGQPKDGPNKDGVSSAYCAAHRAAGTQPSLGRKGSGKWKRT
jgi:GcrA cell cycle regulator